MIAAGTTVSSKSSRSRIHGENAIEASEPEELAEIEGQTTIDG